MRGFHLLSAFLHPETPPENSLPAASASPTRARRIAQRRSGRILSNAGKCAVRSDSWGQIWLMRACCKNLAGGHRLYPPDKGR